MLFTCLPLQGEGDRASGGGGAQKLITIYIVGALWCTSSASQARHLLLKEKAILHFHSIFSYLLIIQCGASGPLFYFPEGRMPGQSACGT